MSYMGEIAECFESQSCPSYSLTILHPTYDTSRILTRTLNIDYKPSIRSNLLHNRNNRKTERLTSTVIDEVSSNVI